MDRVRGVGARIRSLVPNTLIETAGGAISQLKGIVNEINNNNNN
jgi:hypothetical protein